MDAPVPSRSSRKRLQNNWMKLNENSKTLESNTKVRIFSRCGLTGLGIRPLPYLICHHPICIHTAWQAISIPFIICNYHQKDDGSNDCWWFVCSSEDMSHVEKKVVSCRGTRFSASIYSYNIVYTIYVSVGVCVQEFSIVWWCQGQDQEGETSCGP